MATLDVMPSASDYVPAAATSIKRALDLYASELDYDLPPAVKVKTKNLLPECVLPADVEIKSAGNAVIPKIEVSAAQEIAPLQPSYGRRLIPQLIDQRAEESPELPLWSVPISSNLMDGFRDISYGQVARAINRAAWWIDGNIGKSTTFETLAYMGPPDLRYAVLTVAAQKTGHTVSRPSYVCLATSLMLSGFLFFTMEQHRSAPSPSQIRKLPSLHYSGLSLIHCHFHLG